MPTESYSNPLAPLDHKAPDDGAEIAGKQHPLTNDDFRKLLMTPRPTPALSGKTSQPSVRNFSHRASHFDLEDKRRHGEKKKKAHFYVKHENEDELLEILKKYRDRARERRDGELKEYQHELELITATGGYRAVAPDIKACLDAAERRKQMIEESKYLGGDIEHTHLVKGLDYALLQKVRSEISAKQIEEVEVEKVYQATKSEREEVESQVKSPLAKNIYALLFKAEVPKVNDMFAPRRMAYVVELDDNSVDTDIPTTLIRSKQECPVDEASANLSINDMVIQKLTQVLAYLRTDSKRKKKGKDKIEDDSHLTSKSPAISTPHKYFTNGLLVVFLTHLLPVTLGIVKSKDRRLFLVALAYVVAHSFIPHKELRFLLPILPLLMIYAGQFLYSLRFGCISDHRSRCLFSGHGLWCSRSSQWLISLLVITNLPVALYAGLFHQRGALDLVAYVRHVAMEQPSKTFSVWFLMPCHSTPFYSHVHLRIEMRFLTCHPNLNGSADWTDEADIFHSDPVSWLLNSPLGTGNRRLWPSCVSSYTGTWKKIQSLFLDRDYKVVTKIFNTHFPQSSRQSKYYVVACSGIS